MSDSIQYFNTYLLLEGYKVSLRNILPSTAFLIGIPFEFLWGYLSDRLQSRYIVMTGVLAFACIPTGILAFWGPPAARLFAFMVEQTYFVTHLCESVVVVFLSRKKADNDSLFLA